MTEHPTDEEILAAHEDGRLFDEIFDDYSRGDEGLTATAAAACARLHNQGRIDILALIDGERMADLPVWRFFSAHDFFAALIPALEADTGAMVAFVDRVVAKGGEDGAAGWPKSAFEQWCAARMERIEAVLSATRAGNGAAIRMLDAVLVADGRPQTALSFVETGPEAARPAAVHALGRLKLPADQALEVLKALDRAIPTGSSDMFQAQRLDVAIKLARTVGEPGVKPLTSILRDVLIDAGPLTLMAAARSLWPDDGWMPQACVDLILEALGKLDPKFGAVVSSLDHALRNLLKGDRAEQALAFVERYVEEHAVGLDRFGGAVRALLTGPKDRFNRVFVRWMISDVIRLAQGMAMAMTSAARGGGPIAVELSELTLTERQAVRLCKRAVGHFFIQPVSAASILVAVLRQGPPEAAEAATELLFDPLLINYGGETRDYLLGIEAGDRSHAAVSQALARADAYVETLRSVGEIKEMRPAELHLILKQRLDQEQMRAARKAAGSESTLKDLFTNSLVLHGNKVRTWHVGPDGKRRAFDVTLQSHGISMELPRTEIADPVDLDYRLRVYCLETEEDAP